MAAGAALAALPVILHLFMKQTPKRVIFPALRLIRERQKRSRKRLRIKNWLLLLARMALLALMALALARPSLLSHSSAGDQDVPTAIGLVFDTSLSMGYTEKNKTRLEEAKERAYDILKKTPDSSQVFVVDSALPGTPVPLSPASARKQIEGLELSAGNRTLNVAVGQVYAAIAESDRPRHEVFVLTDLERSAWNPSQPVEGLDKIKKVKTGVATYVLRLTPKDAHDVSVIAAEPSATVATQGETVEIVVKVRSQGEAATRVVEFYLDGVPKDKKTVELPANGEAEVRFTSPKLDPKVPLHQGYVRITGAPDPLSFDDWRYFTFRVEPAKKVLVLSDLAIDAEFLADALDPDPNTLPGGTPRTCQVERIKAADFGAKARDGLKDYTCVFLNNVQRLDESDWGRLNAYVHDGGGLVVGLGDRCLPENYNGPNAGQLLPALLKVVADPDPRTSFGKVADFTHPLFQRYAREVEPELSRVPVSHYWVVVPSEAARALLSFADNAPALLERSFKGTKTGRVLLWTTPLARRVDSKSPSAWNEFPQFWPFLAVTDQTVPYMAGTTGELLNYEAGQDVILPIDSTRRFKNYLVQYEGPTQEEPDPLSPPATSDSLVIVAPQPMGQWKVTATGPDGEKGTTGFSLNPPLSETQLAPLEKADLDVLFGGEKGYLLADSAESLEHNMTKVHIGHELFPWLMFLILLIVTAENLLANKFYRETGQRTARRGVTGWHWSCPPVNSLSSIFRNLPSSSRAPERRAAMSVSFSPIGPWPLVALASLAVMVLTIWAYRQRLRGTSGRWRWLALGLRLAAVLLCLLAALRPSVVYKEKKKQAASIVVLADRSMSMSITDEAGGASRWAVARKRRDEIRAIAKTLGPNLDVKFYDFDMTLQEDRPDNPGEPIGRGTALGAAMLEAVKRQQKTRVATMVVLADGHNNDGIAPEDAARQLRSQQIPVLTVGFGSENAGAASRDISFRGLVAGPTVFVKNQLQVEGTLVARGFPNQSIDVEMLVEGQSEPVARTQVPMGTEGQEVRHGPEVHPADGRREEAHPPREAEGGGADPHQ